MKIHEYSFPKFTVYEAPYIRSNELQGPFIGSITEHLDRWGWTEAEEKESVRLWAPITLKEGKTTRRKDHVESVTALVIDYDDGTTLGDATNELSCAWMAYTTHSHKQEHPKFRLVIPLLHPVPAEDWPMFWAEAVADIAPKADQACKDASRIFYTPSHRPGLSWPHWWEAYCEDDDALGPSEHEWIDKHGEVHTTHTHERKPLDPGVYLLAAREKAKAAGVRKVQQVVPTLKVENGTRKDWTTFDPRAWAAGLGLKSLEGTARLWVECPWAANHSDPSKDTIKDAYFRLDESPHWFGCSHAHCHDKKLQHIMREMRGEEFCK
jgi:hypothetical protein